MYLDLMPAEPEDGEEPPPGDMGWLWFKPVNKEKTYGNTLFADYHPQCSNCEVFGVKDVKVKHQKCWCCGRFVRNPKAKLPLRSTLW